jgi:hypothetical protein
VTYYAFRNVAGFCLEAAGQDNGSTVRQATCNGTVNQQWTFKYREFSELDQQGWFRLVVAGSGRCLAVEGAGQEEGRRVEIRDCNNAGIGSFNYQWAIGATTGSRDGRPFLGVRHSFMCLGFLGSNPTDGAPAVQSACGRVDPQSSGGTAKDTERWLWS